MKFFIVLLFIATVLYSCEKHPGDILSDLPNASLVIYSPWANSEVSSGDSIRISAKAISDQTIHGYDLIVKKLNTDDTLYYKHIHDHNDTLLINVAWKDTIPLPVLTEAVITLVLDHDNNTLIKKVPFKIQ
jgi:hypothetical protein